MALQSVRVPIFSPSSALREIQAHVDDVEAIIMALEDIQSLQVDLEQGSRLTTTAERDFPRIRSLLDEKVQLVHEKMGTLRASGLFLKEHPQQLNHFYIDAIGVFNRQLAWLCWCLGEQDVRYYHPWRHSCDRRMRMTEEQLHQWEESLSELTFFML